MWKAALPLALLFLLWKTASGMGIWSQYVLPSPERVFRAFVTMIQNGSLFGHVTLSQLRLFTRFFIAIVLAHLLGDLAGE